MSTDVRSTTSVQTAEQQEELLVLSDAGGEMPLFGAVACSRHSLQKIKSPRSLLYYEASL